MYRFYILNCHRWYAVVTYAISMPFVGMHVYSLAFRSLKKYRQRGQSISRFLWHEFLQFCCYHIYKAKSSDGLTKQCRQRCLANIKGRGIIYFSVTTFSNFHLIFNNWAPKEGLGITVQCIFERTQGVFQTNELCVVWFTVNVQTYV